jgi:hypothetical protein
MIELQKFQTGFVELLVTYKAQLLTQDAVTAEFYARRTLASKLLYPFKELLPHDGPLLDAVLSCEGESDAEVVKSKAEALYRVRGS